MDLLHTNFFSAGGSVFGGSNSSSSGSTPGGFGSGFGQSGFGSPTPFQSKPGMSHSQIILCLLDCFLFSIEFGLLGSVECFST